MDREELRDESTVFFSRVWQRLITGEREYQGSAETRPGLELARELEEEAADLAGWGFWAWMRARRLREGLERLEAQTPIPLSKKACNDDRTCDSVLDDG